MSLPNQVSVIGGGVIGGAWAARFVLNGVNVKVFDPDPEAPRKIGEVMKNAEHAQASLVGKLRDAPGRLEIFDNLEQSLDGTGYVQEAAPERLELKQSLFAEVDSLVPVDVLIGSSTSGLKPSDMQREMTNPERLLVAHPFNPVYLLPLVELVAGEKTDPANLDRASDMFREIGMHPLKVKKEIEAFVADRLMEALWREALWLVKDGIATTEDIDDAIRYGCGLRWAQMGTFQVFDIAGGEAGMRHFMAQFGPALKWPWTKLMDTPEMDDELIEKIALQVEQQADGRDFRELERIRDDNLVAIMQALKPARWGAGQSLADYEDLLGERNTSTNS